MRSALSVVTVVIAVLSNGCSKDLEGDLDVLRNYGDVVPRKLQHEGETYGVLDRPDEGRMIAVSLGPWWGVNQKLIEQTTGAAERYLHDTARDCKIDRMRLASGTDGSMEFFYSCNK